MVRAELVSKPHGRYVTDVQVWAVMTRAKSPGVAADAICMWPRPQWVEDVCGPYPASLELANPEDVASEQEWGPLG